MRKHMRTPALLFSVLVLLSIAGNSQSSSDFKGTWAGKINVGQEVRVIFHISQDANGFKATGDSPDQGAMDIKCDTVIVSGDSIRIEIKVYNAVFAGRMTTDSTLTGTLTQGMSFPVVLTRTQADDRARLQTPRFPFPYKSVDVEYDNDDRSIHYGATITIPEGKGPFPAAVLITGSGQQDRDETIMGHKLFAVLADALTRNGIIVLRVDDRGIGKSTGDVMSATSADFAKDVNVSFNYLLSRPEVDKKKAGLIGHSEGGMIAPIVGAQRSDIDFIVLLAAPGVSIQQLMAEQNEAILNTSGFSKAEIDAYIPYYKKLMGIISSSTDSSVVAQAIITASNEWVASTDQQIVRKFGYSEKEKDKNISMLTQIMTSKWFKYFLSYDPGPNLEKLRCKVLAINGSKDIQVLPASNLAGIEKSLKKSKSRTFTVKELPGLNHLFQTCKTCSSVEYGALEETFSPVALKEINDWLSKYVK